MLMRGTGKVVPMVREITPIKIIRKNLQLFNQIGLFIMMIVNRLKR